MRTLKTIILRQDELIAAGLDINSFGMTANKNRPYIIIASNRQMTWLVPLTTQLKHAHGRIEVVNETRSGDVTCEAICTDIVNIATRFVDRFAIRHGRIVEGGSDVLDQMVHHIMSGRLGSYPNAK